MPAPGRGLACLWVRAMNRYAPENCVYFDFESRCSIDIKTGSYRYAIEAEPVLLSYAIGLGPVQLVDRRGLGLTWTDIPDDLKEAFAAGKVFCAWNTGFDRAIWNYALAGSPLLEPAQVIDAQAAALAHNLPGDLQSASVRTGGPGKQKGSKKLIATFCGPKAVTPDQAPEKWQEFCAYARRDTAELRRIFMLIVPALTDYDWRVYRANECINETGAGVDLDFCREAARLADEEEVRIGQRLVELTKGEITSINQHLRLAEWVHDRLSYSDAREIMSTVFKEEAEDEDDDALVEKVKLTVTRGVVERLLDFLRAKKCNDSVLMEVLELREFGASAAPRKFKAILESHIDGRVFGQFQFNGGGQTGRFSGRGVQLQNLTRTTLGSDPTDDYGTWEEPTVALIAGGCTLEELRVHGAGEVPARKLALTIRPAFVAKGDRTLVKADYRQIEARVLPWLSASKGGEKLLASFRHSDVDPSAPDLYKVTAAGMTGKTPEQIGKDERQKGKVAVLACGFGGGRNALLAMAANYRMHFSNEEAQAIVNAWRAANPWAAAFWGRHNKHESYGLFGAARSAMSTPMTSIAVGRVQFVFIPARRDGMLICILPSGRPLIYPSCRMRDYDIVDKVSKQVIDTRHGLTFRRARGIIALYGGRFAENITQAAAADLLREAIVRLVEGGHCVVSHSHDEIVVECERADVAKTEAAIRDAMTFERDWTIGLPLAVDVSERWYYSAAKQREENVFENAAE
jgi:DNA polymerase bacteriophage-type